MSSSKPADRARFYQDNVVPAILGPMGERLVEAAELQAGERVLDIACGTGAVTRMAARAVGKTVCVTGMDLGLHMLDVAREDTRQHSATIRWIQGDATTLPFADATFDIALCSQGLMFFPDRPKALRDAYRVVVPGGRLAMAVWSMPEHNPYFLALYEGLHPHIDEQTAATMRLPFALSEPGTLESVFINAGLSNVRVETVAATLRLPTLEQFIPRHMKAMSIAADLAKLSSEVVEGLIPNVRSALRAYEDGEAVHLPFEIRIALADGQI